MKRVNFSGAGMVNAFVQVNARGGVKPEGWQTAGMDEIPRQGLMGSGRLPKKAGVVNQLPSFLNFHQRRSPSRWKTP